MTRLPDRELFCEILIVASIDNTGFCITIILAWKAVQL
ncbi:hypothetical protein M529_14690 [Sphingobium ummariense RL-3]|uniref:Uncharacterized protein n=1 Tax=Sphingobium ummariense RL-3 TaxID=1346791 RepID=T0KD00_9SPHN|nr:hypothetical protein M529_14690 [Sphingobium ummariense RL-3]